MKIIETSENSWRSIK